MLSVLAKQINPGKGAKTARLAGLGAKPMHGETGSRLLGNV